MKNTSFTRFAVLIIACLSIMPFCNRSSAGRNDDFYIQNDQISISITGGANTPAYSLWQLNQNNSKYQVKFNRLFEVVDENQNGEYDKGNETIVPASNDALASLSWNFSAITTDGAGYHFNLTSQGENFTLQFRNHLNVNGSSLKFDIFIENYEFVSKDENAMLVLGFHLQGNKNRASRNGNKIEFGDNGYLESETTAQAGNKTIKARMKDGEENGQPMAYISFSHFNGTLLHDPTIGFSTNENNIPGYSGVGIGANFLLTIGIIWLLNRKHSKSINSKDY
ncbi:hypothetical protein [Candidatus Lokiarchaeum ossiferum]|uniref:hypothetical protein n=1 Tax=Candidatus Lokiarchaeum ossiferum TaxID=2951803 RepID=UPI00352E00EF